MRDFLGLGGPVSTLGGGWDWWVLICIPITYLIVRRLIALRLPVAALLAVGLGTVLSDLVGVWGVAPATGLACAFTLVAVALKRARPLHPPSV